MSFMISDEVQHKDGGPAMIQVLQWNGGVPLV